MVGHGGLECNCYSDPLLVPYLSVNRHLFTSSQEKVTQQPLKEENADKRQRAQNNQWTSSSAIPGLLVDKKRPNDRLQGHAACIICGPMLEGRGGSILF